MCVSGLEFERWLSGCGPPLYEPDLSAGGALTQPVQDLCDLWRSGSAPDQKTVSTFDLSAWSTFQIVLFLDRMLDLSPLPHGTLTRVLILLLLLLLILLLLLLILILILLTRVL